MMRLLRIVVAVLLLIAAPAGAFAYRLPALSMTPGERALPAEESLARYEGERDALRRELPAAVLIERHSNYKARVSPRSRAAAGEVDRVQEHLTFWTNIVDLKRDLLGLPGVPAEAAAEADAMAKTVIQTIYDLSQEYRVAGSALIQNTLINFGIKKKGFCYHYVDDLRRVLLERPWRSFELHWGEAWARTFLENNALVITAPGAPFESGIAVDAWRSAGKPFWTKVKGDRFPWKEAFGVEIENP